MNTTTRYVGETYQKITRLEKQAASAASVRLMYSRHLAKKTGTTQINAQSDKLMWAEFLRNKQLKGTTLCELECFRDHKLVAILVGDKI